MNITSEKYKNLACLFIYISFLIGPINCFSNLPHTLCHNFGDPVSIPLLNTVILGYMYTYTLLPHKAETIQPLAMNNISCFLLAPIIMICLFFHLMIYIVHQLLFCLATTANLHQKLEKDHKKWSELAKVSMSWLVFQIITTSEKKNLGTKK